MSLFSCLGGINMLSDNDLNVIFGSTGEAAVIKKTKEIEQNLTKMEQAWGRVKAAAKSSAGSAFTGGLAGGIASGAAQAFTSSSFDLESTISSVIGTSLGAFAGSAGGPVGSFLGAVVGAEMTPIIDEKLKPIFDYFTSAESKKAANSFIASDANLNAVGTIQETRDIARKLRRNTDSVKDNIGNLLGLGVADFGEWPEETISRLETIRRNQLFNSDPSFEAGQKANRRANSPLTAESRWLRK